MRSIGASRTRGTFPVLMERLFGTRDPVEKHLHTLARQGARMARLAHMCAFIMLVLFSLGSLVGIAGESATAVLTAWPHGRFDLINGVAAGVSAALVLCMDVASLYAALMLRTLVARGGSWRDRLLHIAAILLADVLEAGSIAYMTWRYDPPLIGMVWVLIIARDIAAPFYAVYLQLAQPLPVRARDTLHVIELDVGAAEARDAIQLANDPNAPLGRKLHLLAAVSASTSDANRRDVEQLQSVLALWGTDALVDERVPGANRDTRAALRSSTARSRRQRQARDNPHLAPSGAFAEEVGADEVVDRDPVPRPHTARRSNARKLLPLDSSTAPIFHRDVPARADTGMSQELRSDLRVRREEVLRQLLATQPTSSVREMCRLIEQGTGSSISESTAQGLLDKFRAETHQRRKVSG